MFSPSSGRTNSEAEAEVATAGGACAGADCAGAAAGGAFAAGGVCATGGAGGSAGLGSAGALASAAFADPRRFPRVKMTWPTLSLSPSFTRISFIVPLTEEGTSTTALSVSSSITGWPSVTLAPGEIISRTKSPCSIFSPSSGSLNSVTICQSLS